LEKKTMLDDATLPQSETENHDQSDAPTYSGFSATYSPDDNKLRLYARHRLDRPLYDRVKAAGFTWAPKQELFVAPMWTPAREDLLLELAGEIDDEDKSLTARAEDRAERFENYSEKRGREADQAQAAVSRLADGIPFGQPILVGHHSEKRARKDAEKIRSGMDRAVKLWKTSTYWTDRAAGAIAHAKYKELPKVRARRIKTIEADLRKVQRSQQKSEMWLKLWTDCGNEPDKELQSAVALKIANVCWLNLPRKEGDAKDFNGHCTAADALSNRHSTLFAPRSLSEIVDHAKKVYPRSIEHCARWIAHYENRLSYEKAMLDEQGASDLLKPKPRRALLPLLNYRAPDGITTENQWQRGQMITYPQRDMTKAEYAAINQDYKGTRVAGNNHRFRTALVKNSLVSVFLTDAKEDQRPEPTAKAPAPAPQMPVQPRREPEATDDRAASFEAMQESLKAGVQVVSADQLFPTPPDLARNMAQALDVQPGMTVLEPSAGTGNLLEPLPTVRPGGSLTVVEINQRLCDKLEAWTENRHCGDFLELSPDQLGTFDRIIMNPPFSNGADIAHIKHALKFLKPGGRLVALCAHGPRQWRDLGTLAQDMGGTFEQLPEGSFRSQGTSVNVALIVLDKAH
jgi:phospholipid N-methyltransferase